VYAALSEATHTLDWVGEPNMWVLNKLTRLARDSEAASTHGIARRQIDYVAKALLFSKSLKRSMGANEISELFTNWTISRLQPMELSAEELAEFRSWLMDNGGALARLWRRSTS
jgi:hypothetical protein